jgi:hypothetical protein
LHESLIREDRFYRELAAANEVCRKASLDALHMRDDFFKELAAANAEIADLRTEIDNLIADNESWW